LRADEPREPEATAACLRLPPRLEATVFAAEPMLGNPTNLAVDARGRVWACDVSNYRHNQGTRPEGDRIVILEDVDGDGRADKSSVFYQGPEVDSALGICLLDDCVLVSCSPNVWMFFDDDGDDRADRREALFTDAGQPQHDHSVHACVCGPDGQLYWNLGNENQGASDRRGRPLHDRWGRAIRSDGRPFRQGLALRSPLDGSAAEVLAHNLRNSYELTVDAFGGVWFSDNDDDGHQGTRICYALEGGNYGYTEELTGRRWTAPRTNVEDEIPRRHWFQNDPGVVPNAFFAGGGSPAGIANYDGPLLGDDLDGALLHCEPGRHEVRAYVPRGAGAEIRLDKSVVVDGREDPWFRPVDVAAAPDGSLMVADWYDPGIGGHRQADVQRGRIYRIAPRGMAYGAPLPQGDAAEEWAAVLDSPNDALRRQAWQRLAALGPAAQTALETLLESPDPRRRARALWLLARLPGRTADFLERAARDADDRVRVVALRAARDGGPGTLPPRLRAAVNDASPLVRREAAVELRRLEPTDPLRAWLWAQLAARYAAGDRWSLEALGLGADGLWDACLTSWLALAGSEAWREPAGREIVWRARGPLALAHVAQLLADPELPEAELPRLLRAVDFSDSPDKPARLIELARQAARGDAPRRGLLMTEALLRLHGEPTAAERELAQTVLQRGEAGERAVEFIQRFRFVERYPALLQQALADDAPADDSVRGVQFLLRERQYDLLRGALSESTPRRTRLVELLAASGGRGAVDLLLPIALDPQSAAGFREEALRAVAANRDGAEQLVDLAEQRLLDHAGRSALAVALKLTPFADLAERTAKHLPPLPEAESEPFPLEPWMRQAGDAARGRELFVGKAACNACHRAGGQGGEVGPGLAEIGSKLSRAGLYEAVLYPSAAISHNYETYVAQTVDGTAFSGILTSRTNDAVTLRNAKGVDREIPRSELAALEPQAVSLMPSGLQRTLGAQELADLVAYLASLRKAE
jgi:putative membrane-bound dehydrogenase-like protein